MKIFAFVDNETGEVWQIGKNCFFTNLGHMKKVLNRKYKEEFEYCIKNFSIVEYDLIPSKEIKLSELDGLRGGK